MAAQTSMLHIRVDDKLKSDAAATLADFGLTVSDAVRVLERREAARADLPAIVDHIPDDNPDAAQRLKDDIEAKAAKLLEHPKHYRSGHVAGPRETVVRSNYVVVYVEPPTL